MDCRKYSTSPPMVSWKCRACNTWYFNITSIYPGVAFIEPNINICDGCFKLDAEVTIDDKTYLVHNIYPEEFERRNASSMTKGAK